MPAGSGLVAGNGFLGPGSGLENGADRGELLLERAAAGILGNNPLEGSYELVPEPGQFLGGHLIQRTLWPDMAWVADHGFS